MEFLTFYTDGGCLRNGKPDALASFAAVCKERPGLTLYGLVPRAHRQSNQTGEMFAVIMALRLARECKKVTIVTDSRFVIDMATKWLVQWKRKGKTDMKNPELVEQLWEQLNGPREIVFRHVAAHQPEYVQTEDAVGNREADRLASLALAEAQKK